MGRVGLRMEDLFGDWSVFTDKYVTLHLSVSIQRYHVLSLLRVRLLVKGYRARLEIFRHVSNMHTRSLFLKVSQSSSGC